MSQQEQDTNRQRPEENPDALTGLHMGDRKKKAAGLPAVLSSFRHIFGEAGIARGLKALAHLNQKGGFDCPSCAWPDPDDERSRLAEYCENGAKAVAEEATTKKLTASFFAANSLSSLATLTDYEIGKKGRIASPMYLPADADHYQPISWDEAFRLIGRRLGELSSPDEAVFYTSGRTSNEAAFLYQLFVRAYGTNNLPDCSNMCHESSGVALTESLGIGKGSVKLEDFYQAEAIMILGQNPGTNHPRMLTALQKAKANGAVIISVNPLPETGLVGFSNPQTLQGMLGQSTPLTDIFLPVRLNGDMALLQALELLLWLEEEKAPGTVFDQSFIRQHTTGYSEFITHLQQASLQELADACGLSVAQIGEAATALKDRKKIIVCWAMGLTQHKNAVDTIKEVVNLLLLKGSIGKPGAGTCPVRGHSNVQGDRTVGIFERPSQKLLDSIKNVFGFEPPRKHGYDVVAAIKAMYEGRAKVFFAMGGNFLSATPDTIYTAEALRRCRLTVHVSTKLNRSHLIHGEEALILPCLSRSDRDIRDGIEQFVSCENSMGVVQQSKGVLQPVSDDLLSEPVIVCRLALATLGQAIRNSPAALSQFSGSGPQAPKSNPDTTIPVAGAANTAQAPSIPWERYMQNYDFIRDDIERTIPGFDQYNRRVREPGGFYLPNCNRDGKFDTSDGKARFNVATPIITPLAPGEFMMMTIRSHDQFNTTIYGLNDRYRGIYNERRVILMNPDDMRSQGLQANDIVDLVGNEGGTERIAHRFIVIPYPIPRNCTATYYPETNVLVPIDSIADKSNTPVSKLVIITLRPCPLPNTIDRS